LLGPDSLAPKPSRSVADDAPVCGARERTPAHAEMIAFAFSSRLSSNDRLVKPELNRHEAACDRQRRPGPGRHANAASHEGGREVPIAGRRRRVLTALIIATTVATAAGIASAESGALTATGTLELRASLGMVSNLGACPPGINADACAPRTGQGSISGLGRVSETYTWSYRMGPPTCPSGVGKPLATTGRLVVAGRGEIHFAVADGARCIEQEPLRFEPQDFTITGGTGTYAGASGRGKLERDLDAGRGTERWIGTLVVPGLEFDVTPPTLSGTRSKTVRASRGTRHVRVTHTVTARDVVDGKVPVTCAPRSGSRLPIGRTVVTCSATDSSANTSTAKFAVTVRERR
jgi:hypothetical protein